GRAVLCGGILATASLDKSTRHPLEVVRPERDEPILHVPATVSLAQVRAAVERVELGAVHVVDHATHVDLRLTEWHALNDLRQRTEVVRVELKARGVPAAQLRDAYIRLLVDCDVGVDFLRERQAKIPSHRDEIQSVDEAPAHLAQDIRHDLAASAALFLAERTLVLVLE